MPSDATIGATSGLGRPSSGGANRKVALWLFAVCFMIWVMVGIGGYTRDSGSGLSIMNWDPIIGTLPPMSDAAWNKMFALYQTIPQYQILHRGMDLAGFKSLFWPEYIHRLWGRLIGVVFFAPLVFFIVTRQIEKRLIPWLALLFVLGGLQGAIGWFMVASGFDPNSVAVEPWRLSLHFSAAMILFIAVLWTGLNQWQKQAVRPAGQVWLRRFAAAAAVCLALTMFAGTFVSGTHAIDAYDAATGAGLGAPPPGYMALQPWWMNFFVDKASILFNHQSLAALTVVTILTTATMALRNAPRGRLRDAGLAIGGLVILQFILGVTALVSKIFIIGVAHQMNAVLLLAALVWLLHGLRGAPAR
jgi:cytochrome c oxidase assembly protein subunit 15